MLKEVSIPVDTLDLAVIGLSTAAEVWLALIVLYVAAYRRWPGYIAKNCGLVIYMALAGMLVNLAVAMRYGWWGVATDASEPLAGCNMEAWLLWSGVGLFFGCSFLRVYRCHNVLVLHDGFMSPVPLQLVTLLLPFLVPPAYFLTHSGFVAFDQDTQECERQSDKPEAFAFGVMLVLVTATVALTCSLGRIALQAPEEVRAAVVISVTVLLAVIAVPLLHEGLEEDPDERRRAMLVLSSLMTLVVVASPLAGPLKASADFDLSRRRLPGDSQKISQDRMQINALASSPGGRYIPESSAMAWFFRDSLDRESLRDPFLLQAATMKILEKYIRKRAPMPIPLSPSCRDAMLKSRASSAVIFDRARQEVMEKLGGGRVIFCASPTDTVTSGESPFPGSANSGDVDVFADAHYPESLALKPRLRAIYARNAAAAAVSGPQETRLRLGAIGDGTSDLSQAFGLRPAARHGGSESEEDPTEETSDGLFVGHGGAAKVNRGNGVRGGTNNINIVDPFADTLSPRRDELSAVELADFGGSDSLSDFDPFQGLQGTLDFNYAESIASIPGLAESMGLSSVSSSGTRTGGLADKYRGFRKKHNEVSISASESSEESDRDGRHHGAEIQVVKNPLFVDELKKALARRQKNSG